MDVGVAGQFRLNITAVSDTCNREILQHDSSQPDNTNRTVTIWTRKQNLTRDVYVEESQQGKVRVVKQVTKKDKKHNWRSELDAMGSVCQSKEKQLFVDFIGWFPLKDQICLVMEYCSYGDLSKCYSSPVSEIEAWCICAQLLEGLAVLHRLGVVHRDIKPQNILVVNKRPIQVKISDFGHSKRAIDGQTEPRSGAGTHGYMAPEVFQLLDDNKEDSAYTSAVDIWSLGCLLYYILTKQIPFGGFHSLLDFSKGRITFPDGPLRENRVSFSGRSFISGLMERLPEARPKASVDTLTNWVIPSGDEELLDPEFADSPIVPTTAENLALNQRQPSLNDMEWSGILGNSLKGVDIHFNEMDYFSSELWNFLKLNRNNDPSSKVKLQTLLTTSASCNRMCNGYTALHIAAEQAPPEWVQLLLEYGADVRVPTEQHRETALHLTTSQGDFEVFSRKVRLLLDFKTDIDAQNADGDTVLHLAIAAFGSVSGIQPLLEAEASTNIKGRNGRTPLLYAIYLQQETVAMFLLDKGSDPHSIDDNGRSALHLAIAAERSSIDFIGRLTSVGVDVDWKDDEGHTPLHVAAQHNKRDMIRLLLDHGADRPVGDPVLEERVKREQPSSNYVRQLFWPFR
ncbi:hypothetical protein FQN54_005954 [Arachnomyces sp. PD_36]|nr:hypothetical protein FQN54_005954 [Arachnomyces sp. PD_36]